MKLKELIEKYKKLEGVWDAEGAELARQIFLQDLEQLDEPEPVKVPQFVADWIEEAKKSCETVVDFFRYKFSNIEMIKYLQNKERINLVARAWLDGYEVEKEKRYIVSLKNGQPLVKSQSGNHLYFNQNITAGNYKFTRKQLEEAGFGWVFDCEGVEVEEED